MDLSLSQTSRFDSLLEQQDEDLNLKEVARQHKFVALQAVRREKFEDGQADRQMSFYTRNMDVSVNVVQSESKRATEFSVWMEGKTWEMQRRIREWQSLMEKDEDHRDGQLELYLKA